jgi:hypothetical protein
VNHALAAVFRAMNDMLHARLKSRNVHSEVVFSLNPNNNVRQCKLYRDLSLPSPCFSSSIITGYLKPLHIRKDRHYLRWPATFQWSEEKPMPFYISAFCFFTIEGADYICISAHHSYSRPTSEFAFESTSLASCQLSLNTVGLILTFLS